MIPARGRALRVAAVVALSAAVLLSVTGCKRQLPPRQYARDPLAASGPAEAVLRVLRLSGFQHAGVWVADGDAGDVIVRAEIPSVTSAADVELAWQTAFAGAASAFPDAPRYVVQLFAPGQALAELSVSGEAARAAVAADDPAALRSAAATVALDEAAAVERPDVRASALRIAYARPGGAASLPESRTVVDVDVPGAYLEEKDRAQGWTDPEGAHATLAADAEARWEAARREAPLSPEALELATRSDGLSRRQLAPALTAEALSAEEPYGSVLRPVAEAVAQLMTERVPRKGEADEAVLAAADRGKALRSTVEVARFDRREDLDGLADDPAQFPGDALARYLEPGDDAGTLRSLPGTETWTVSEWLGYERSDGRLYWLAGRDGPVALTEGDLRGWGYTLPQAWLVDAERSGRVLEWYPLD